MMCEIRSCFTTFLHPLELLHELIYAPLHYLLLRSSNHFKVGKEREQQKNDGLFFPTKNSFAFRFKTKALTTTCCSAEPF